MKHGGDVYTEGLLKGVEHLDFSSNINPLGIPKSFKTLIASNIDNLTLYPDAQYRLAKNAISMSLGVETQDILLGNGAAELLDISVGLFGSLLIVVPSFSEYKLSAERWGARIVYSHLNSDLDFDYEDILDKFEGVEALVIANPNNPNGTIIDKARFEPILRLAKAKGKYIILDEAFVDFALGASFVDIIDRFDNLIIIRALTKYYAMPGLRIGYGICRDQTLVKKILDKQLPWNINYFAELALQNVLDDKDYHARTRDWLERERPRFVRELEEISFVDRIYPSKANYLLCKLIGITDEEVYRYCLGEGILIRKCSNYIGLDERYIRLAIKDSSSNDALLLTFNRLSKVLL